MIEIRTTTDEPIYEQIVAQVRMAVASGRLKPGDRLDPVRELARRLGVNASTVARAYRQLEQQGIIETHHRGGTVIAAFQASTWVTSLRDERLRAMFEAPLVAALTDGFTPEEVEAAVGLQLAAWRARRLSSEPEQHHRQDELRLRRFAGSHDLAMESLWARARQAHPEIPLEARYVGSLDGLLALLHGEAALAGTHLLDEESGAYNLPILRRLFIGQRLCVVSLAERQQGLLVPLGNPQGLRNFADLAQPGVRIINRQPGSGTRTLLDFHLHQLGIPVEGLSGYDLEVATHLAVAEAVAKGRGTPAWAFWQPRGLQPWLCAVGPGTLRSRVVGPGPHPPTFGLAARPGQEPGVSRRRRPLGRL